MPQSRVLAILLTDIRDFTDRTAKSTRSGIFRLIEKHRQLVLPVLQRRGGALVKTIGDAFLVVFNSPTDAVLAGVEVQRALTQFNSSVPEEQRIDVRIAINMGEVNVTDNDIYGEPVNVVSRIEGVAEPGEVFFTEAVYLNMNKAEVPSSEVGWLQLKGVSEKVRVYKVRREAPVGGPALDEAPHRLEERGAKVWAADLSDAAPRSSWAGLVTLIVALVALGLGGSWYVARHRLRKTKTPPKTVASSPFRVSPDGFRSSCNNDVRRFCNDVLPGEGRVVNCLKSHLSQLSPECRQLNASRKTSLRKI